MDKMTIGSITQLTVVPAPELPLDGRLVLGAPFVELERLRAEVQALRRDGPPMQRGTDANGSPWMGTMRECLEDYKLAAHAEAEGRRHMEREVEAMRKDAERYRKLRDGQNWPAVFARHDEPEPLRGVDLDAACDGAA